MGKIYRNGECFGAYSPITDELYRAKINKSPYSVLGESSNVPQGYLRQYNQPKKMVVLGNSITMHGYREADGIAWTVGDYREMASTTPTNGWVTKVYKYLHDNVNENLVCYKANASTWEVASLGTRNYDKFSSQKVAEVDVDGPHYKEDMTVNDILTEDVDIIFVQLSENVPSPTMSSVITEKDDVYKLSEDYLNLYRTLQEKCPNAVIYQLFPFWADYNKSISIFGACKTASVVPIQMLSLLNGYNRNQDSYNVQSSVGTKIYDADGNVIATVSEAVSGHPSDLGFSVMAKYALNALYNQIGGNSIMVHQFARTEDMNVPSTTEFYHNRKTDEDKWYSVDDFSNYYATWFNYFLTDGVYITTFTAYGASDSHGILEVKDYNATTNLGNTSTYFQKWQTLTSLNYNLCFERGVQLRAYGTSWLKFVPIIIKNNMAISQVLLTDDISTASGSMSIVRLDKTLEGKPIYRLAIKLSQEFKVSSNNWSLLSFIPKDGDTDNLFLEEKLLGKIEHILDSKLIPNDRALTDEGGNTTRDYRLSTNPNSCLRFYTGGSEQGDRILMASSSTNSDGTVAYQTFYAGDIIMFEFTMVTA